MATQKHIKLKEDEHRKKLENGITALLSSQEFVMEELHKLFAEIEALSEKEKPKVKK
ncbi:MAG: hypothetical protein KAJ73_01040 [Zetaproteobacteria bacterium]|nr:hypothetical protein [Zetaproteobacteria bacterium]